MGPTGERVGRRLRALRQERRLTLQQLAEKLQELGQPILLSALSKIENGQRRVDVDDLVALALALDVSPNELLLPDVEAAEPEVRLAPDYSTDSGDAWNWASRRPASRALEPQGSEPVDLAPTTHRDSLPLPLAGLTDDTQQVLDVLRVLLERSFDREDSRDRMMQLLRDVLSRGELRSGQAGRESGSGRHGPIPDTQVFATPVSVAESKERKVGIITGDIKRVRWVDVWVNPENTKMEMARIEEDSTSSIIRFHGAKRDSSGNVLTDTVANDLAGVVGDNVPVAPGSAFKTVSGSLAESHNVKYIIHVAAVQGEPGAGYRQVREVGQCIPNALTLGDQLATDDETATSILFPILGTGVGGGSLEPTVRTLVGEAVNYLRSTPNTTFESVYFLAYKFEELDALTSAIRDIVRSDFPYTRNHSSDDER